MKNIELIVSNADEQLKIAVLSDGLLQELHEEKEKEEIAVGDVVLGKIKRLKTDLNAAFVDVGYEKDAFLHYLDLGVNFLSLQSFVEETTTKKLRSPKLKTQSFKSPIPKEGKIEEVLKSGDKILVQISKEAISSKGPRITSEISLAGRYLVLTPFSDKVSVSKNISDEGERKRLKTLINSIKHEGFGVIIRTAAEQRKAAELHADLNGLFNKWNQIFKNLQKNTAPLKVLSEVDKSAMILRDNFNENFSAIHCDDAQLVEDMKIYIESILPGKEKIVKLYHSKTPIFDHFGVERQVKQSFGKTVSIPSSKGAYLVIEHTEALHVIDVNSGGSNLKSTNQQELVLQINLLAADEIARQLKLRDMGGIIVVDFIDMSFQENRKQLYERLKDAMSSDKAKHNILPPSKFGLVQITRQRVRPEKSVDTHESNPDTGSSTIKAPITLISDIEDQLESLKTEKKLSLHVHPYIAAYLTEKFWSIRLNWFMKYKKWIKIIRRDSYKLMEFRFYNHQNKEV